MRVQLTVPVQPESYEPGFYMMRVDTPATLHVRVLGSPGGGKVMVLQQIEFDPVPYELDEAAGGESD